MYKLPFRNFTELWPHQVTALEFIKNSDKKIIALNAPTGSGKTVIGMMCKVVRGLEAITYTTISKYLQHQITEDFIEAELLKGRANYACNVYPNLLTANECSHSKENRCQHKKFDCYYDIAKSRVLHHPYRILNLPYWLNEANYVGEFSNQEFVVIHEGDMLESMLTSLVSLPITFNLIKNLRLPMPKRKTKWEDYIQWADAVVPLINKRMKLLEEDIDNENTEAIKRMARLGRLKQKIKIMKEEVKDGWLMSEDNRGVEFKPLWLDKQLVEKYLLQHSKRFLVMSATLPSKPILSGLFGIPQDNIDYHEVPSTFDIERRLVYYDPVVDLSKDRMKSELPKLIRKIKEIVNEHPDKRILIHSVSYKLARAIYEGINSSRCIIHDSQNKDEMVGQYLQQDNAVIISPSLERGVDFHDEKCRVVIWAKVPYLSLGDKFVTQRLFSSSFGRLWYKHQAIHSIVQGTGRAMRHENDWCEAWIIDRQFERLMKDARLAPNWFREAVVWK